MDGRWSRATTVALLALLGATTAAARAGLAARDAAPLAPVTRPAQPRISEVRATPERPLRSSEGDIVRRIGRATARNPFRPDRSRPAGRYGMPAPIAAPSYDAPPSPVPLPATQPPLRLLGVAAFGGGSGIATLALEGQTRLVRVGEQIEGYRLLSVAPGEARLQGPDGTIVLRLDHTGPSSTRHP